MNLKQIREEAYAIAREIGTDDSTRLWSKAEMNRYINRTYRYIARECRCIRDAMTPAVCRITSAPPADLAALTLAAATDSAAAQDLDWYNDPTSWLSGQLVAPYIYPLHKSILEIEEVKWTNRAWRLIPVSVTKWQTNPFWEQVIGLPIEYALDYSTGKIVLNYRSQSADTLKLIVRRMPLVDLVADTDEPEFRDAYHNYMINDILAQMYSKQDAQTLDKIKASDYQARFLVDVDEIKQQESLFNRKLVNDTSMAAFR